MPTDTNRHLSHLVGLFPGRQISPLTTPALAAAAKVSLAARGDASTAWAEVWRAAEWARLRDGAHAYKLLNLWVAGRKVARVPFGDLGRGISPFPFAVIYPQDEHERLLVARLADGQALFDGKVKAGGVELAPTITMRFWADRGTLQYEITNINFGPLPVPGS